MDYTQYMSDMDYIGYNGLDYVDNNDNYDYRLNDKHSYYVDHYNDYTGYHDEVYSNISYIAIYIGVLLMVGAVCCGLFFIIGFGVGWKTQTYKTAAEKRSNS